MIHRCALCQQQWTGADEHPASNGVCPVKEPRRIVADDTALIEQQCAAWELLPAEEITRELNVLLDGPKLEQDKAKHRAMMDYNARLVTRLRQRGIWPERRRSV